MKKIMIASAMLLLPWLLPAQTQSFRDLYNKYAGQEQYVTIEMSGEMFNAFNNGSKGDGGSDFMNQFDNLVIIVSEAGSATFIRDAGSMITKGGYESLSTIRDGDRAVGFYLIRKNDIITEFLMTVSDSRDYVIMSITGKDLNVNQITQLARKTQNSILR